MADRFFPEVRVLGGRPTDSEITAIRRALGVLLREQAERRAVNPDRWGRGQGALDHPGLGVFNPRAFH